MIGRSWRIGLFTVAGFLGALALYAFVVAGGRPAADGWFIVTALLLIVVGELVLVEQFGRHLAPLSTACAMALVLSPVGVGSGLPWVQCLLGVALAMGLGSLVLRGAHRRPDAFGQASRFLGVAFSATLGRIDLGSGSLGDWANDPARATLSAAAVLTGVALAGVLLDLGLWTVGRARSIKVSARSRIRYDLAQSGAVGAIMTIAGPLIAVTEPDLGAVAILIFVWPIALALVGLRRVARIDATHRQLVLALARLSDETGHTTKGHARRVAQLAAAMGEDVGLGPADLADLRDAALLHDVGQVTLNEPIPDGATVLAAPAEQSRVIRESVRLAEHAGAGTGVVGAISASTVPFRQQREDGQPIPLIARILKVANAYDDLTQGRRTARGPALERIHLGLGYEYDPAVVDALTRVTEENARPPARRAGAADP